MCDYFSAYKTTKQHFETHCVVLEINAFKSLLYKNSKIEKRSVPLTGYGPLGNVLRVSTKSVYSNLLNYFLKGVCMPWPKKIFLEFIVGLDRVAQEKLFGVGGTLLRPRVCPLETV